MDMKPLNPTADPATVDEYKDTILDWYVIVSQLTYSMETNACGKQMPVAERTERKGKLTGTY